MDLDVRLPIGLMFTIFGVVLAVFGALSAPRIDIDLAWGLVLIVFGAIMLALALRARRSSARRE